ncbi:16S rRNA (guanine(527)-N(7))-methyltransferase RsmG, partial [Patescibacteria group bacterium]|nr:16S rRNA (guanine(527)-N(7))-methyltransferase RsmG [Patescibacteria group bacterium]
VVEEGSGVEAVVEEGVGVEKCSILDLGTGGGFPLLPLAICLPQCQLTGVDATQKKVAAVERIANALEVKNVNIIAGRAEELGHDKTYREQFDLVLSRAVAPINTLLEYCAPFTKVKGHIVLWKSMKIEQELKDSLLARAELSCHLTAQHEYELPEKFGKRQLLIFEKTFQTSEKYPREIGIPKKNPIV